MAIQEPAGQGGAMAANSGNEKRSIWSIMVGVFTGPAEAFAAYDKRQARRIPIFAAILAFFFGPFGMLYVRRFWVALGIQVVVLILGLIVGRLTGAYMTMYFLSLAYSISMSIWAFRISQLKEERTDQLWWGVLVISLILAMTYNGLVTEYQAQMQYDMMSQSRVLPPQVLDQMKEGVEHPNYIKGGLTGGVAQIIIALLTALLAWGIGSFVMGGDTKFSKVWGVALLGELIYLVGNLVKLPLMMAKGSMYVSFGLAAFMPDKDFTSIMYWLLYYLDGFMIWSIIVTGIGFAAVFNISRGKGIAVAAISSVIMMVVMMGLALMGMSLAGVEITFF